MLSQRPIFKTNYLKTNLLKQIKKNFFPFRRAKLLRFGLTTKFSRLKTFCF